MIATATRPAPPTGPHRDHESQGGRNLAGARIHFLTPLRSRRGAIESKGGVMFDRLLGPMVHLGLFVHFAGQVMGAAPRALVARAGEVVRQFERVAWGSLPVIAVAGLSVGMVTWLQTRRLLVTYGAQATLPSILTVAVMVETGPL